MSKREVRVIPLICDNAGCEKLVGHWKIFSEYEIYYREQVKRNGTFYCSSCYRVKKKYSEDLKKQTDFKFNTAF